MSEFVARICEEVEPVLLRPIPLDYPGVDGWKDVPIEPEISTEPELVPIGLFAPEFYDLASSSVYYGQYNDSPYKVGELPGAMPVVFLRPETAGRLLAAQRLLPDNYKIVVCDGYRSYDLQKALYDYYFDKLLELHKRDKDWDLEKNARETQLYVSMPSTNETRPSPHETGTAVDFVIVRLDERDAAIHKMLLNRIRQEEPVVDFSDLGFTPDNMRRSLNPFENKNFVTVSQRRWLNFQQHAASIVIKQGEMLRFGTRFDHGDEEAGLLHLEKLAQQRQLTTLEQTILYNHRVHHNISELSGLPGLTSEWWHRNLAGSQMGAVVIAKQHGHEARATYGRAVLSAENFALLQFAKLIDIVDPARATSLPPAAIIAPASV